MASKRGLIKFPCFQSQIVDAVFFRRGPSFQSPQYFQRSTVCDLVDLTSPTEPEVRTLQLGQIPGPTLEVYDAKFQKQPGDKVDCRALNEDGKEYVLKMPHYGLTKLQRTRENMKTYIRKTRNSYLSELRFATDITWLTAQRAISMAVAMWAYCRVIEKEWKICGDDTLDLEPITDPKSPWYGFIPITPAMDVQLDQIVIRDVLQPLRTKLLARLQDSIQNYRPDNWFDCYFTIFMLLNHIEQAAAHGNWFSKINGLGRRYSDMKLAEAWFHTTRILLSRFHFVSNGSAPLRLDWGKAGNVRFANFSDDEIKFLRDSQALMAKKRAHVEEVKSKHKYEHDLYWTHQLFSEKWEPGLPHIVDEIPD
ncbi:uncharacterized protein THITE_2084525 [Thermothielavioides terrestris NRRL 8126]|uniref:Uncharacterized protein n=1 Tax=Thermothielavioides terrestris (strain ATCC 38088 / NRRL 8126) TaxID=578455 RepID=G2QVN9_THETT|nr:uncharacterized protein THITE_2084525 [Thermothielavioides terrestris NRRL 8126]AEO63020.1 hypothetical protein THITE_2084525 [Thermothielavioides terrestris NRRL 8126]